MIIKYIVKVKWLSAEDGGRKDAGESIYLSTQCYYCTTLLNYDPPTWSIKLQPIKRSNRDNFYLIFLFKSYPKIIKSEDKLPLYEGPNLVGEAIVIDILETNKND